MCFSVIGPYQEEAFFQLNMMCQKLELVYKCERPMGPLGTNVACDTKWLTYSRELACFCGGGGDFLFLMEEGVLSCKIIQQNQFIEYLLMYSISDSVLNVQW
jgi:hypothetical protein